MATTKNLSYNLRTKWFAPNIQLINGRRVTRVAPKVSEFYSAGAQSPKFHIRFRQKHAYIGIVGFSCSNYDLLWITSTKNR